MTRERDVVIIGAGIAGLSCARALARLGHWVRVVDKGRGPGGRMSSRRSEPHGVFDHGAVAFRAGHMHFLEALQSWGELGLVAPWKPRQVVLSAGGARPQQAPERWVGVPRMSAITRALSEGLDLRCEERIVELRREDGGWTLIDERGEVHERAFHTAVVALPAPQAASLLAPAPELASRAAAAGMAPAWTAMLHFADAEPAVDWDEALCEDEVLQRIVRESSKPDREGSRNWVLHAQPMWSAAHLEQEPAEVLPLLQAAFERLLGAVPPVEAAAAHRWRYAHATDPLGLPYLWDPELGLGAVGDWCLQGNVEGAWLSGEELAQAIQGQEQPAGGDELL